MVVTTDDHAIPRKKRRDCRNCGYRVAADAQVCPHCHTDPRQWHPLRSMAFIFIPGALVLAFICALAFQLLSASLPQSAGLKPQPTAVPQIIYTIATPITPTATFAPTATPLPTVTFTPRFSPTPTRKGAPTITTTRPAPTPTVIDYAAPKLNAPSSGAIFTGADENIVLEWQSVSPSGLRENEWYQVSVSYASRNGGVVTDPGWSRETRWNVKRDLWSVASPVARTFSWNIQVMRIEGADPYASPSRAPASPASETRKFEWR